MSTSPRTSQADMSLRAEAPRVQSEPALSPPDRNRVSIRSLLLGLALCALMAWFSPYAANILLGSSTTVDHTAVGATAVFFLLVLVGNGLARRLEGRLPRAALPVGTGLALAAGALLFCAINLLPPVGPETPKALTLLHVLLVLALAGWLVFALVVTSRLLERLWAPGGWLSLSRAELLMVFTMMLLSSTVVTMGLTMQLVPALPAAEYYANPANRWPELLLPNLPGWARVSDPAAVSAFFEGLHRLDSFVEPQPQRFRLPMVQGSYEITVYLRQIPWGPWIQPLLAWGVFLAALYLFMIASMVVIRRQWMDREVLVYPLARLPNEMAQVDEAPAAAPGESPAPPAVSPLLRNPALWLGFSLPVIYTSLRALHFYFPAMPPIPREWHTMIMSDQATLWIWPSFVVIGFTYLIHTRVAFSIWSLALAALLISGWLSLRGYKSQEYLGMFGEPDRPFFYHLGMGAFLAMSVCTLWSARRYFAQVFRTAWTGRGLDDSDEILSYRAALLLCIASTIVMLGWLMAAGMQWWVALAFWTLMMLVFYGVTRIVVEAGLGACVAPGIAPILTTSKLGTQAMAAPDLAALGMQFPYCADIRTFAMVAAAYGLKLTAPIARARRRIFWGMVLALAVSLFVSVVASIYLGYVYQGTSLDDWYFRENPRQGLLYAARMIQMQPAPNVEGWVQGLCGVGAMLLLIVANRRWLWWPIHPVGLALMGIWITDKFWFSVLIGWLCKALILKLGGRSVYVQMMPLFLGMILGQCVIALIWLLIDYVTGTTGNSVYWI